MASMTAPASAQKQEIVLRRLPYGLACNMVDDGTFRGSWVYCWVGLSPHPTRHAKLDLNGQFSVTATTPLPQGLGGPGQPFGTNVDLGPFRCVPLHTGVKCTVIATGSFNIAAGKNLGVTPISVADQ